MDEDRLFTEMPNRRQPVLTVPDMASFQPPRFSLLSRPVSLGGQRAGGWFAGEEEQVDGSGYGDSCDGVRGGRLGGEVSPQVAAALLRRSLGVGRCGGRGRRARSGRAGCVGRRGEAGLELPDSSTAEAQRRQPTALYRRSGGQAKTTRLERALWPFTTAPSSLATPASSTTR